MSSSDSDSSFNDNGEERFELYMLWNTVEQSKAISAIGSTICEKMEWNGLMWAEMYGPISILELGPKSNRFFVDEIAKVLVESCGRYVIHIDCRLFSGDVMDKLFGTFDEDGDEVEPGILIPGTS